MAQGDANPLFGRRFRHDHAEDRGDRLLTRTFQLWDAYGATVEVAHEVLTIALTSASRPVVVDVAGVIHGIPRRRLAQIVVWDVKGG